MKKIFFASLVFLLLVPCVQAQKIQISPSTPLHCMTFYRDTVIATDSSLSFYTATNMNIIRIVAMSATADTGSASPAGVITLHKTSTGTSALTTSTILAANTPSTDGAPLTSVIGHLVQGYLYKLKILIGTSDKLYGLKIFVYYTQ